MNRPFAGFRLRWWPGFEAVSPILEGRAGRDPHGAREEKAQGERTCSGAEGVS